jgi:hypothetical protein
MTCQWCYSILSQSIGGVPFCKEFMWFKALSGWENLLDLGMFYTNHGVKDPCLRGQAVPGACSGPGNVLWTNIKQSIPKFPRIIGKRDVLYAIFVSTGQAAIITWLLHAVSENRVKYHFKIKAVNVYKNNYKLFLTRKKCFKFWGFFNLEYCAYLLISWLHIYSTWRNLLQYNCHIYFKENFHKLLFRTGIDSEGQEEKIT